MEVSWRHKVPSSAGIKTEGCLVTSGDGTNDLNDP